MVFIVSPTILDMKFKMQNGKCVYCSTDLTDYYERDHIVPKSKGGSNDPSNLQLLCYRCNRKKGKRSHRDYLKLSMHLRECTRGNDKCHHLYPTPADRPKPKLEIVKVKQDETDLEILSGEYDGPDWPLYYKLPKFHRYVTEGAGVCVFKTHNGKYRVQWREFNTLKQERDFDDYHEAYEFRDLKRETIRFVSMEDFEQNKSLWEF